MATIITYSNLFSEARNNVLDMIKNNLSDPITSASEFRKFIYSRRPDVKNSSFSGYPYVIIYPSELSLAPNGSADNKTKMATWNIEIEIVTSDRGYGNNDAKGLSHMDTISDSIATIFASQSNTRILRNNGIAFATPESTSVSNEVIQNELVYTRSFLYSFRSRKRVSA